ncbi:MAG: sulfotransferase [Anaerolineales bacterium]|nr:sulfotransferase [Chloroflexota bacterium]MBL6980736.1 sulfotransferase [Anaerolineales bacterium]
MSSEFRLVMLSAMYENGGNVTHRLFDGHKQMYVYPFESQIGTRYVVDHMSSAFPVKYRWPVFSLDATPDQDYFAIIDEECKVRARTPHVSKFRHMPFEFSDDERREIYKRYVAKTERSASNNIAAFFRATFDAWKDYNRTGKEKVYVGYSPIIVIDADKILNALPKAHVVHVVRNPWSAYADTKKRPVPMSLQNYMRAWVLNQYHALLFNEKYPDRMHVVRTEDVIGDPINTLGRICRKLSLDVYDSLATPTWNGSELNEVYPWGTIRKATSEANLATANELSDQEKAEVRDYAGRYIEDFDYTSFLKE